MFVRLARVFALFGCHEVNLTPTSAKCTGPFATNTKQNHFRDVSEVESDTTSITATVLSDLVPNQVRLVFEYPCFQSAEPFWQKGIRTPKVALGGIQYMVQDRKLLYLDERKGFISAEPMMFGCDLSCAIRKTPSRICKNCAKLLSIKTHCQVSSGTHNTIPCESTS